MLHMICGKTSRDGISNETICDDMTGLEKIKEFLRKQRWFEHMVGMDDERALVKAKQICS